MPRLGQTFNVVRSLGVLQLFLLADQLLFSFGPGGSGFGCGVLVVHVRDVVMLSLPGLSSYTTCNFVVTQLPLHNIINGPAAF